MNLYITPSCPSTVETSRRKPRNKRVLKTYYQDFTNGRLGRLPWLGHSLLLAALILAFILSIGFAIGGAEKLIGGDLAAAQELIRQTLAFPFLIIFAVFILVIVIAGLNIAAKRARDIGLPGWIFVAGLLIITGLLSQFVSPQASQAVSTIATIGLLFTPGNMFKRR